METVRRSPRVIGTWLEDHLLSAMLNRAISPNKAFNPSLPDTLSIPEPTAGGITSSESLLGVPDLAGLGADDQGSTSPNEELPKEGLGIDDARGSKEGVELDDMNAEDARFPPLLRGALNMVLKVQSVQDEWGQTTVLEVGKRVISSHSTICPGCLLISSRVRIRTAGSYNGRDLYVKL